MNRYIWYMSEKGKIKEKKGVDWGGEGAGETRNYEDHPPSTLKGKQ